MRSRGEPPAREFPGFEAVSDSRERGHLSSHVFLTRDARWPRAGHSGRLRMRETRVVTACERDTSRLLLTFAVESVQCECAFARDEAAEHSLQAYKLSRAVFIGASKMFDCTLFEFHCGIHSEECRCLKSSIWLRQAWKHNFQSKTFFRPPCHETVLAFRREVTCNLSHTGKYLYGS